MNVSIRDATRVMLIWRVVVFDSIRVYNVVARFTWEVLFAGGCAYHSEEFVVCGF